MPSPRGSNGGARPPQAQARLLNHLLVFVMVVASLWMIWAVRDRRPVARLSYGGWGVGLAFHGFDAFRRPFREGDVQAEMQHLRQRG